MRLATRHLRRQAAVRGAGGIAARAKPSYRGILAEVLIAGSVDEVAEQFRAFGKIGYTESLVRHLTNDQPKVLVSLERLAAVREALA